MSVRDSAEMLNDKNGFWLLGKYRSAIMGFAALWIFLFHEWNPIFYNHGRIFAVENFVQRTGYCGVDIFLFLSGMGMVYSIGRSENLFSFYYKRIKRIAFPFLLVAVLRCRLENWPVAEFLKNISGINFYRKDIYSFLWFVPMIMTFYILFPLYYRFFIKSSNKVIFTCSALMLWLAWTLRVRMALREDLFGFTNRIPIFLIGILFGWISQNKEIIFDRLAWGFCMITFLLGLYLSYLSNYAGLYILVPVSNCCIPDILISISLSFLLAGALYWLTEKFPVKIAGKIMLYILSFYGMFTLEFYCIQEWLGGWVIHKMADGYGPLKINAALVAAITATAFVVHLIARYFWLFVERMAKAIKSFLFSRELYFKISGKEVSEPRT